MSGIINIIIVSFSVDSKNHFNFSVQSFSFLGTIDFDFLQFFLKEMCRNWNFLAIKSFNTSSLDQLRIIESMLLVFVFFNFIFLLLSLVIHRFLFYILWFFPSVFYQFWSIWQISINLIFLYLKLSNSSTFPFQINHILFMAFLETWNKKDSKFRIHRSQYSLGMKKMM